MYNRYIPQPDGTFRRNRMPDRSTPPRPAPPKDDGCRPEPQPPCPPPPPPPCAQPCNDHRPGKKPDCNAGSSNVGSFLKNLLPKDFDTGDLLIVLLLLIMSGDCAEDQNTALLTLALYLFM